MTVLITGGAGFVGINVADALLERDRDVVLFGPAEPPEAALRHLRSRPGRLAIAPGDVRDGPTLSAAIARHGVTALVHGAAITAALEREVREARLIAEVNLLGTIEVLEAALRAGIGTVVQLGTGAVFGSVKPGLALIDEATAVPVPDSLYGITKYAAERTALRYRATRGLNVTVARLGVVFGRWEYATGVRDTLSPPYRLSEIAEARGHARFRPSVPSDWVYASDVGEAVARLLEAGTLPRPVYHVATGASWSVEAWCGLLAEAHPGFRYECVGPDEEVNVGGAAPNWRPPFAVDALRDDLGFTARFGLNEAFADYTSWRQAHPGALR